MEKNPDTKDLKNVDIETKNIHMVILIFFNDYHKLNLLFFFSTLIDWLALSVQRYTGSRAV